VQEHEKKHDHQAGKRQQQERSGSGHTLLNHYCALQSKKKE
jgi:hypothetical protein